MKERSPKYKKTVLIQVDNLVRVAKYARRPNKTVGIFCANVRAEQRHLYLELYTAAQTNSFLLSDQKKIRGTRGGRERKDDLDVTKLKVKEKNSSKRAIIS